jgi:hypothetical protein
VTAPVLAQADQFCMCGCTKSRHKGKGMCKDCGEFECDKFEVDQSRLPAPGPDTLSTSAALRQAEAERDEYKAHLDAAVQRANVAVKSQDAMIDRLAALEEAAGRDIGRENEPLLDRIADLKRGREEATQRALELAKRVADLEQHLAQACADRETYRTAADVAQQRTAELEAQIAADDRQHAAANERIGDLERQLAASQGYLQAQPQPITPRDIDPAEIDQLVEQFHAAQHQPLAQIVADVAARRVHTYPALYCRTCYGRFLEGTPAAETHQHPLVPVTVTITERTTT